MKRTHKNIARALLMVLLPAALLAGCAAPADQGQTLGEKGLLTLSVNPEIQIEYNKEGRVTALTGGNEDGRQVVQAYPDYVGKPCGQVLSDLIGQIHKAGYFVEEVDGNAKSIVLELEPGSALPSQDFLQQMSACTQQAVKELALGSGIVTIDEDDHDPAYAKNGQPSPYITLEKAQQIALAQAGVAAGQAVFEDKEFDHDDGTPVFELEFAANGVEYEYDVHAVTGKVLKAQHQPLDADDRDDDLDDRDDDRDDRDDDLDDRDDDDRDDD